MPSSCEPCRSEGLPAFGFRIGLSLALAGQGMVFGLGYNNALGAGEGPGYGSGLYVALHLALIASTLAVGFLLGGPLLRECAAALSERRVSVEALFVLSALGAFVGSLISTLRGSGSVYYEVVSIVLCVYAIGKQIGVVQKGRVGAAVASFREAFDRAAVSGPEGIREGVAVAALQPGDRVLVRPGDAVPVDGWVQRGSGYLRETALTGEPGPVRRQPGDRVTAGTWSIDGTFEISPELGQPRVIDQILHLLNAAPAAPSRLQESADRLMQGFVPLVSLVSLGTFLGWFLLAEESVWVALFNAMAVLLVACPCALGLALPAGIWAGLYYLGQRGIVGRHGHLLDSLAACTTVVFDKTGTLSQFELEADPRMLTLAGVEPDRLREEVASLGRASRHPVSQALAELSPGTLAVSELTLHPGEGLSASVEGRELVAGEAGLLERLGIDLPERLPTGTGKPVWVGRAGRFAGAVFLHERLREEAADSLRALQKMGCACRILSGDPASMHAEIGGVPVEGSLTPEGKAAVIRSLVENGEHVLFIGDGVNDLPAMQASQASLAIELGVALATEYADGLLVGGRVQSLPMGIRHARRLKRHLRGNLRFALAYNLIGMSLAAAGLLHPVVAALLMVGSSALVSARAMRAAGQLFP